MVQPATFYPATMDVPILAIVLFHLHLTGQMTNGMYQNAVPFTAYGVAINGLVWVGCGVCKMYVWGGAGLTLSKVCY